MSKLSGVQLSTSEKFPPIAHKKSRKISKTEETAIQKKKEELKNKGIEILEVS